MSTPTMTPVESSNIRAVGYDMAKQRLFVTFKAGNATYAYDNVTKQQFDDLLVADSIGSLFSRTIKSNPEKHPFTRI